MLDIKYIRQEPDAARERLAQRGEDAGKIDELLALDEKRRGIVTEVERTCRPIAMRLLRKLVP